MASLTQEDIDTLQTIGHDTVRSIVALVVESILYTLYFVCIVIAGRILLGRRRSKISVVMFSIILTMFLLDTAMSLIDVNNAIREITLTLTSTAPLSFADRYALADNLPWTVQNSLYAYMVTLGDVVIVWRAYAFWCNGNERLVMLIPVLFLVGSFTTSGLVSYCVAQIVHEPEAGQFINPPFCRNIQRTLYCMTVVTTATATGLIFYKTWLYRRHVGARLSTSSNKTRAEKVMLVLIESGILYFLFSLEFVIADSGNISSLEVSTPELAFASTVWTYMTSHILGIYPAIMVIIVHSQRSYLDQTVLLTHSHSTTGSNSLGSGSDRVAGSRRQLRDAHTIEINVHETHELDGMHDHDRKSSGSVHIGTQSTADEWLDAKGAAKSASIV